MIELSIAMEKTARLYERAEIDAHTAYVIAGALFDPQEPEEQVLALLAHYSWLYEMAGYYDRDWLHL